MTPAQIAALESLALTDPYGCTLIDNPSLAALIQQLRDQRAAMLEEAAQAIDASANACGSYIIRALKPEAP
jgi:hypothetical protein